MKKQEKELLLKDLCARLPYGVRVKLNGRRETSNKLTIDWLYTYSRHIEDIKPYLRPMSSMTKEEIEDYHNLCTKQWNVHIDDYWYYDTVESIDWLNANHFDHRGLIPMGLALPAEEGMYK